MADERPGKIVADLSTGETRRDARPPTPAERADEANRLRQHEAELAQREDFERRHAAATDTLRNLAGGAQDDPVAQLAGVLVDLLGLAQRSDAPPGPKPPGPAAPGRRR